VENLQILCPNCHALTDNYCGKNITPSNFTKSTPKTKSKEQYSKEELEEKINSPSFESIAKLAKDLNISRGSLRNLFKKYDLVDSVKLLNKHRKKLLDSVICEYCGKPFKPARNGAKYCSTDCFKLANGQPIGEPPTREEILSQVNNYNTMDELAKHFGYKDLRHPCKKAELPLSIKELRKLI
jgi:hypothetical protein